MSCVADEVGDRHWVRDEGPVMQIPSDRVAMRVRQ
jgi:hypothetical protein